MFIFSKSVLVWSPECCFPPNSFVCNMAVSNLTLTLLCLVFEVLWFVLGTNRWHNPDLAQHLTTIHSLENIKVHCFGLFYENIKLLNEC